MSFLDRLFGRQPAPEPAPVRSQPPARRVDAPVTDEQAIARYRYMVRTASPDEVEQAHAEAFAKLTPGQRAQVLRDLGSAVSEREREAAMAANYEPQALARAATRAEMRQPGVMERSLGGMGGGMAGGMAGTLLASVAGGFIGSMIAQQFFGMMNPQTLGMIDQGMDPGAEAGADAELMNDTGEDTGQWGAADDPGMADDAGDVGDFGDFGGDF